MSKVYVAITTTNFADWRKVCTGGNADTVRQQAERMIVGPQWDQVKDIYTQTKLVNLRVVSKTEAKRKYGVDIYAQTWPIAPEANEFEEVESQSS